ncbi:MAG: hypothetical protein IJ581_05615 [Paludibacteraceae bacterium]|nr:hypothetical protein [Paludibacteraceae bacterium]
MTRRPSLHNILILSIFSLILLSCSPLAEPDLTVVPCTPIPVPRAAATVFTLGDKAYILGGRAADRDTYLDDCWQYDPAADTWTRLPDPPFPGRVNAAAITVGNTAYYGLGYRGPAIYRDSCYLTDWWTFDGATWTRLPDFPDHYTDGLILFATDTCLFSAFGWYDTFWHEMNRFSFATRRWYARDSHIRDLHVTMAAAGGTADARHFAGTGYNASGDNYWAEYLPATNRWVRRTRIPTPPRCFAATACAHDALFVLGGRYWAGTADTVRLYDDVWQYVPAADTWRLRARLPQPAENMIAFTLNGRLYFGLGEDSRSNRLSTLYRIDY